MRFARTIRVLASILLALVFGAAPSSANEIPSLTWERGKTLNVVLGGYAENLDWRIFLEGPEDSSEFSDSTKSDAGFIVYSISLPRKLTLGQYEVVARDDTGAETRVAAVQIVERFQYNVLEIPRDFLFWFFLLVVFLGMQVTLRTWVRRESDGLNSEVEYEPLSEFYSSNKTFASALMNQRIRLKRGWAGYDFVPNDFVMRQNSFFAIFPLVAFVAGLYSGVTGFMTPIETTMSIALLALLVVLSIFDRYSAKLASIGLVTLYILFNSTLNFPSLLGLALLVFNFFLPQYVGDVTREFLAREMKLPKLNRELKEGAAALAAGASVFWLYLLGESIRLGSETDASKITPVAIAASLAYFLRNNYFSNESVSDKGIASRAATVLPLLRVSSIFAMTFVLASVVFIWSENFFISTAFSVLVGVSLFSIHFVPRKSLVLRSGILASAGLQLAIVLVLEMLLTYAILRLPEVTIDRAKLTLLIAGLPIAFLAIVRLFTALPNSLVDREESNAGQSPSDIGKQT